MWGMAAPQHSRGGVRADLGPQSGHGEEVEVVQQGGPPAAAGRVVQHHLHSVEAVILPRVDPPHGVVGQPPPLALLACMKPC